MRPDSIGPLEDIRDAAQFIADDTAGMTFDTFAADWRIRQLVERNFEIMGEAVNRLRRHDPETASRIREHNRIVALRNALIHGYDAINYSTVWRTIQESLPVLRAEVEQLLREAEDIDSATTGA
jgi:uncharacterized protein with HEPN domain